RLRAPEGAVNRFERGEQVAVNLHSAEHVGLAEIELRIPDPARKRAAILEDDGGDWRAGAWDLEPVPQREFDRRRLDRRLDSHEGPSIQPGGGGRNDLARESTIRGCDACPHRTLVVNACLLFRLPRPIRTACVQVRYRSSLTDSVSSFDGSGGDIVRYCCGKRQGHNVRTGKCHENGGKSPAGTEER